jgi:putative chitinase
MPVPSWLAGAIVRAMETHGYRIDTAPGEVNIVYVEGLNPDGTPNANEPNRFNDLRCVIGFGRDGTPHMLGAWDGTTEPSRRWTQAPMNPKGAARIKFGQYRAWQVGLHHGNANHEALVQTGGPVTVHRDTNKDYKRDGDKLDTGWFGINQHHGYNLPRDDLGTSSAGCLVGRSIDGHREFMRIVKSDPRYRADPGFVFTAAIMPASEVLAARLAVVRSPDERAPARDIRDSGAAPDIAGADAPAHPGYPLVLTADALRKIFPRAPGDILDAFVVKQAVLDETGSTHTVDRLAYFLANIHHECAGFALKSLTENINYSHSRAAEVWPSRFRSASDVINRYGTAPGWQLKMFDDVYGNRMGNRPGTRDGSRYIGRGGPQWTGREGYAALQRITGLPAVEDPDVATRHELQPEVCAAFWTWKNMSPLADAGNFRGLVKRWNGGLIGIADREAQLKRITPIIAGLRRGAAPAKAGKAVAKAASAAGVLAAGGAGAAGAAEAGLSGWAITGIVVVALVLAIVVLKLLDRPGGGSGG